MANPLTDQVAAVSSGLVCGEPLVDLDYREDSGAEADANFVLTAKGGLVEVQVTAEQGPFTHSQLNQMLKNAEAAAEQLFAMQRTAIAAK